MMFLNPIKLGKLGVDTSWLFPNFYHKTKGYFNPQVKFIIDLISVEKTA